MRDPMHSSQTQIKEVIQDMLKRNGGFRPTPKEVREEYLCKYPKPEGTYQSQWNDFQKANREWLETLPTPMT